MITIENYDSWKLATPEEAFNSLPVVYWCWNCDSEIYEDAEYYDIQIKGKLYPFCKDCIDDSVKYA